MNYPQFLLLHQAPNVRIHWHEHGKFLYADWIGYQEQEAGRAGGEKLLELLKLKGCSKVLNDNRNLEGPWHHSVEWTSSNWFPRMQEAGLKNFIWICPEGLLSYTSAKRALPSGKLVRHFEHFDDALNYILQLP